MNFFLWSGAFLLFSIVGSAIELASLIGLPISIETHSVVAAIAMVMIVSGGTLALLTSRTPALVPTQVLAD